MKYSFNFANIFEKIIEPYFRTNNNTKVFNLIGSALQPTINDMTSSFIPQKVKEANYNSCKLAFEWFLNDKFNINNIEPGIYITNGRNTDNTLYIWNKEEILRNGSYDDYLGKPAYFLENTDDLLAQGDGGNLKEFDPNYQYSYGDVVTVYKQFTSQPTAMWECISYQSSNDLNDITSWFPVIYVYNAGIGEESDINSVVDFYVFVPNSIYSDGNNDALIGKFVNDIKLYNMVCEINDYV